jgi:hypothetical protein
MELCDLIARPGWIYISMDIGDPDRSKVGMTGRPLFKRATETSNPWQMMVKTYKVSPADAEALEGCIHSRLHHFRQTHGHGTRKSERFNCSTANAIWVADRCVRRFFQRADEGGDTSIRDLEFIPQPNEFTLLEKFSEERQRAHYMFALAEARQIGGWPRVYTAFDPDPSWATMPNSSIWPGYQL